MLHMKYCKTNCNFCKRDCQVGIRPFFGNNDLARLQFIQKAAEYILANSVERKGEVSFLKLFKEHVKRLRSAYNICNPAGILTEER